MTRAYHSRYDAPKHRTRLQKALDRAASVEIRAVFVEVKGDREQAAKALGVSLRHLYREIERLEIPAESLRV